MEKVRLMATSLERIAVALEKLCEMPVVPIALELERIALALENQPAAHPVTKDGFRLNGRVRHAQYGDGTIMQIRRNPPGESVTVTFDRSPHPALWFTPTGDGYTMLEKIVP